nr:OpgC domain-containing protein [uncultured Devosia sp.]
MRYLQIDGLRGLMLVSMALSHLGIQLPLGLTQTLVLKQALINDTASAFVFLSGLTVGLVYARGWFDPAHQHRRKALSERTFQVFRHHVFLVVLVTIMATLALYGGRQIWILERFGDAPLLFGLLSLLMLAGGWCLDVLPLYVMFLLLTPAALSAATSGRRRIVIALVAVAWLAGQAGLLDLAWNSLELTFHLDYQHIDLGLHFNRLSWSALYFSGLLFGTAYSRGEFDLAILRQPRFTLVMLASIALIVGLMLVLALYMLGVTNQFLPTFSWLINKYQLGLLSLLNFLAMAFVTTWLLVTGPTSPYPTMRTMGKALDRFLRWPPLVLLGQHSLLVFTFHLVMIYLFYFLVDPAWLNPWSANAILALGALSLAIPARIGQHLKDRKRGSLRPDLVAQSP